MAEPVYKGYTGKNKRYADSLKSLQKEVSSYGSTWQDNEDKQAKLSAIKGTTNKQNVTGQVAKTGSNFLTDAIGNVGSFIGGAVKGVTDEVGDLGKQIKTQIDIGNTPFGDYVAPSTASKLNAGIQADIKAGRIDQKTGQAQIDKINKKAADSAARLKAAMKSNDLKTADVNKGVAELVDIGSNVIVPGKAAAEQLAKQSARTGAKAFVGDVTKNSFKAGGFTGAYGAAQAGLESEDNGNDPLTTARDAAVAGAAGFAGGAVLGAGATVLGKAFSKLGKPKSPAISIPAVNGEAKVGDLSRFAGNSFENNNVGLKPGGLERAKSEIDNGTAKPIRVRTTPEGKVIIEDGRHRLQAAKELGLDSFPIEDVTKEYGGESPVKLATDKTTSSRSAEELHTQIQTDIEKQASKYDKGVIASAKNAIGRNYDMFGAFRKIDEAHLKAQGKTRKDFNANESLEHAADMSLNSNRQFASKLNEKTKTGDSAVDLIKKYGEGTTQSQEFNNYAHAKFDQEYRAKSGGKKLLGDLSDEDLNTIVTDFESKNKDAGKDLKTYKAVNDMSIDHAVEGGLFSKEEGERIKSAYENAVPLERVLPDDLKRPSMSGNSIGSIGKQSVTQRLEGNSQIPLSNSFDALVNRVGRSVSQANRAKLAQLYLERFKEGTAKGELLVGAGNKTARIDARAQMQEINRGSRYLSKKVSLSNRQIKRLSAEIDKLNVEGMNASIKGAGTHKTVEQPVRTVTVKTVATLIKDNAPESIDELKQSLPIRQMLAREYGEGTKGMQQIAADIHNGGWNQLLSLGPKMNKNTALSLADQILKEPTVKRGDIVVKDGTIGRTASTRSIIDQLLTMSGKDVANIQKKIATREPKLADELNKVMDYRMQIDANKAAKEDLRTVVAQFDDDSTTGKQTISGIVDGEPYKLEVDPEVARVMQGLDETKSDPVLKALELVSRTYQSTWVGVLNPVFAGISAVFYDTPISVLNSRNGFRQFSPDAIKESLKSLNSNSAFQTQLAKHGAQLIGGSQVGTFSRPTASLIASQKSIIGRIKFNTVHPLVFAESLDVLGGKVAGITRTRVARAEYQAALRRNLSPEDALKNAAYAYNNIMPNFARTTRVVRSINAIIPFTSASVAGTRSFNRAFQERPISTSAKALGLFVAPALSLTTYAMASPAGQKYYQDMVDGKNETRLNNNFNIVMPWATKNDSTGKWDGVYTIPLAPEFRPANKALWKSTKDLTEGKGIDGPGIALALFDSITGDVREGTSPQVDTIKIIAGEDPNTGKPIAQGNTASLPKGQQSYSTTSDLAKNIAGFVNGFKADSISPLEVDKLIGQYSTAGKAAKGGDPLGVGATSITNKFTNISGERATNSFYDTYTPTKAQRDKTSTDVTNLVQQGKINEAKRRAQEWNQSLAGKFSKFEEKYGQSDAYNSDWDEMLTGLYISTSDKSFKARAN